MPVISHLAARQLMDDSSSGGGISATAIGLIVGIGIIPVFILIWVVSWLFWCYPYNRSCCCIRRKKKAQPNADMIDPRDAPTISDDTLYEKPVYDVPARPHANYRTESGSSNGVNGGVRLTKTDPRLSIQTTNSTYAGHYHQEPKPFV